MADAAYVSTTQFTVTGDLTADQDLAGMAVRADCGTDGYKYGHISDAEYGDPDTTITVQGDALTSNLTAVRFGNSSTASAPAPVVTAGVDPAQTPRNADLGALAHQSLLGLHQAVRGELAAYADDASAAAGGVAVGGLYLNASTGAVHARLA